MKSHPSDISRSSSLFNNNRNKLRRVEWFIAILFILSLLVGSGVFVKASNAANMKTKPYDKLLLKDVSTIPGSMRIISEPEKSSSESTSVIYMESEDSCELKRVNS